MIGVKLNGAGGIAIRFFNSLLSKWYFPVTLKYFSLLVYIALVAIGLLAYSTDDVFIKQLRNTNAGNLIVWSYWWPAIIVLAIFFGRIWCMVCPVELITSFFAKIGLKRKRPGWLLSGWAITIFYILILIIGIQGLAIHRNPFYMSFYLIAIAGVSVFTGLVYEKNTFCRYVCPVGYLLGLYSRISFFGMKTKSKDICSSCSDKSCIRKDYRYNLNYKSCGIDLNPSNSNGNSSDCIMCAGCVKTCHTYQSGCDPQKPNPQYTYTGFASGLSSLKPLKMAELVFVFIVSGFVISEIWSEWPVTVKLLDIIPAIAIEFLAIENKTIAGMLKGVIIFGFIPVVFWIIPYLVTRATGNKITLRNYLFDYSIAFIPIIAAAHLCKSILKSTSRLPYFEHLGQDLTGVSTAQKIIDGQITLSQNPQWLNTMVSILITIIVVAGIVLSIKIIKLINKKHNPVKSLPVAYLIPVAYGSIFLIMIIAWRWM